MRTTFRYIYAALAGMFVLAGCANSELDELQTFSDPHIKLTVNTCDPQLRVKSDVAGEDDYNENLMNIIHYFFFAKGSTTATAVVKGSASGLSKKDSYTEDIPVSSDDLNGNLFGDDRKCNLFVIANAPESMKELLSGNPTLAQLRAAAVVSDMKKVPQSNFVMVYDDEISIDSRVDQTAIDVDIELKRLACKFTFKADVKKSISTTDGSKTINWTPAKDTDMGTSGERALTITFGNCINKTTPAGFNKTVVENSDYFDTDPVGMTYQSETGTGDDALFQYTADTPIYSYPMDWVFTDQFEPFILFDQVWIYNDGSNQHMEHRYYKMVLGQQSIASNDWYVITAKLTALGNLLPRDPLVLFSGLSYSVYKWNDAFSTGNPNTPANIKAARYLSLPQSQFELQNETTCDIPFLSSHACEISNITVTKQKFYKDKGAIPGDWPETVKVLDNVTSAAAATAGFTFTVKSDKVVFEHELHNTIEANFDHSPYTITFTLKQGDTGTDLKQTITITQYPAIWIEYNKNSAEDVADETKRLGYAYFNNKNNVTANTWNKISGRGSSGSSATPYMVILHVSQFADANYIIGDPRVKNAVEMSDFWSATNSNNISCESAIAKYGTSPRTLTDYYPTEDGPDYYNYIAPVLRVTSAVGRQSYPFLYEQSKVACSSYQEDGYPAGRWRLPTAAEALFINKMANVFHMICPLYSTDQYYWCAGGYLYGGEVIYNTTTSELTGKDPANKNGTYSSGTANTRCVYDEWYWSEIDKEFGWTNSYSGTDYDRISPADDGKGFVWGDMPRNYTHPSSH